MEKQIKAKDLLPLINDCIVVKFIDNFCVVEIDREDLEDEIIRRVYARLDYDDLAELVIEVEDEHES